MCQVEDSSLQVNDSTLQSDDSCPFGESNEMIAGGFGPISGLSRKSIADIVRSPTLSGKKEVNGRH